MFLSHCIKKIICIAEIKFYKSQNNSDFFFFFFYVHSQSIEKKYFKFMRLLLSPYDKSRESLIFFFLQKMTLTFKRSSVNIPLYIYNLSKCHKRKQKK